MYTCKCTHTDKRTYRCMNTRQTNIRAQCLHFTKSSSGNIAHAHILALIYIDKAHLFVQMEEEIKSSRQSAYAIKMPQVVMRSHVALSHLACLSESVWLCISVINCPFFGKSAHTLAILSSKNHVHIWLIRMSKYIFLPWLWHRKDENLANAPNKAV